jgi:hypothetical protein
VDLNGDGNMDILSGSYSHMERDVDMAGWFQVLWGKPGGEFMSPVTLDHTGGKPLTIPSTSRTDVASICTRPTAVDLNGDGHLDIVSGNFGGTFYVFYGQGKAKYAAEGEWMMAAGEKMKVPHHSDPYFVDWDGDGDQDLLSGSADGGVLMFTNIGSQTEAKFGPAVQLVKPPSNDGEEGIFGMEHLKGAQQSTRVITADLNDDGKLDLIVGDGTTLMFPADGLSGSEARAQYAAWQKEQQTLMNGFQDASADQDEISKKFDAHYEKMEKIVKQEMTGFVWVYYQK